VSGTTIMTAINNHYVKTISQAHYYLALKPLSTKKKKNHLLLTHGRESRRVSRNTQLNQTTALSTL